MARLPKIVYIISLLFLLPGRAYAQDYNGVWSGDVITITDEGKEIYKYVVEIKVAADSSVSGQSALALPTKTGTYLNTRKLTGRLSSRGIEFRDGTIIRQDAIPGSAGWCDKTGVLKLETGLGGYEEMHGTVSGTSPYGSCPDGKIVLRRYH